MGWIDVTELDRAFRRGPPPRPHAGEHAVLEWIGARSGDVALQQQIAHAQVLGRDHTGVGCYTKLMVLENATPSTATYAARGPLSGPIFESAVVEFGGGTLLWFEAGRASCLEIYVNGSCHFPVDHSELGSFRLAGGPKGWEQQVARLLETEFPNFQVQRDADGFEVAAVHPAVGRMSIEFASDEITVWVGPKDCHFHFRQDDAEPSQAIDHAIEFIREVLSDRMVLWSAFGAGGAYRFVAGKRRLPWLIRRHLWSGPL